MSKKIIVNKFGGGILQKELIPLIVKRLREQISEGYSPVVVVSAFPGITDKLISSTKNFIEELRTIHKNIMLDMGLDKVTIEKTQIELEEIFKALKNTTSTARTVLADEDRIVSCGEKLSATILTAYFNSQSLRAKRFLAEEIPIITDDNFKNANIKYNISEKNIQNKFSKIKEIPVIAGFTGMTENEQTTTLGRGGTDTTACFVGSALRAEKIILWKDVGGVLSADPKIVKEAKIIKFISYQEAEETGKIIHEKAIEFVKMFQTPIEITSLSNPKFFTKIGELKTIKKGTKIINSKKNLTLFLITDERIKTNEQLLIVSSIFAKYKIEMILISNTRHSLQIVADDNNGLLDKAYKEIKSKVNKVESVPVNMIFLIGKFDVIDVNKFNDTLIKLKTGLQISAFLYENCTRLEAVVETKEIEKIIKVLYKQFIR